MPFIDRKLVRVETVPAPAGSGRPASPPVFWTFKTIVAKPTPANEGGAGKASARDRPVK